MRKVLSKALLILSILVFCISGFKIISSLYTGYNIKNESINQSKEFLSNYKSTKDIDVNFKKLKSHNKDSVAWMKINDTPINYPVVYRKGDNQTYLKTNFDGEYSLSGTLFLDGANSPNFKDSVSFIFGHNVSTSLSFGEKVFFTSLDDYTDLNYMKKHNEITLITDDNKKHKYKIFATSKVNEDTDLYKTTFKSNDEFETYISKLKAISMDKTIKLDKDSKILILSTCLVAENDTTERRLVFSVKEY